MKPKGTSTASLKKFHGSTSGPKHPINKGRSRTGKGVKKPEVK